MDDEQALEPRDEVAAQQRRAELAELRSPLLSMVRYLRAARRQNPESLAQLVEQMHQNLEELLDRRGLIEIGVAAGHLRSGKDDILDYSPMDDPSLFALFQAGVRQMSFHPGLSLSELTSFLEVVAADLDDEENAEEDLTTLLESKELEAIQLVIIETFFESESERSEGDRRMDDVQALIAAATQESLSVDSQDGAGGGTIRLFDADADFFRSEELPALLAALNRAGGAQIEGEADEELAELADELSRGLARCVDELPTPALAVLDTVEGRDADRVAAILAREVNASARRHGIVSVARGLDVIDDWLLSQPRGERRTQLTERVFTRELRLLAMDDVGGRGPKAALARRIISQTPESALPRAVRDIAKMEQGEARQQAFAALLSGHAAGFPLVAKLIDSEPDADLAVDALAPFARTPLSAGTLGLFRAGLTYDEPEVKLRALSWFVHYGSDHAVGALGDALRSPIAAVRLGALLLLVERRADVARTILKIWFDSDDFSKLSFEERRRVMLLLARRMGDRLAPELREQAKQKNLLRRQSVDEERALAMAGLGLIVDEEVMDLAQRYERSPFSGEAMRAECALIRGAFARGEVPYEDPLPICYDELRELALSEAVLASEPVDDGRTSLHSPGTQFAAIPRVSRSASSPAADERRASPPDAPPPRASAPTARQTWPERAAVPSTERQTNPEPAAVASTERQTNPEPAAVASTERPASAQPVVSDDDFGIDLELDDGGEPLELVSHSHGVAPLEGGLADLLEPDSEPPPADEAPVMASFGKPTEEGGQRVSMVAADDARPEPVPTVRPPRRKAPGAGAADDAARTEPVPTVRPPSRREASVTARPPSRAARVEAAEPETPLDPELADLLSDFSFELDDPTGPGGMS